MGHKLKNHYGKLIVGLVLVAVSTVSLMAERAADSTTKRIEQCEHKDKEQDQCLKNIEIKLGIIETKQEQADHSDYILHQKMNELLMSTGMSRPAIMEIEMRQDTSAIDSTVDDSTGKS